jgi:hypothetical protein
MAAKILLMEENVQVWKQLKMESLFCDYEECLT